MAGNADFRPLPKALALFLILTDLDANSTMLAGNRGNRLDKMVDLDGWAIQLADQESFDIERITSVAKGFSCVNGGPIHHLEAARNDAGGNDRSDAITALLAAVKTHQHRAGGFRLFQDPNGHLGDHAKKAFGSGHQAHQVVAIAIQMLAAKADDIAIGQHHLKAQDIVGGKAVF